MFENLEFNKKWKAHIEEGFYGLEFDNKEVAKYLDKEFAEYVKDHADFEFAQIKVDCGYARVHANAPREVIFKWEAEIDKLIN